MTRSHILTIPSVSPVTITGLPSNRVTATASLYNEIATWAGRAARERRRRAAADEPTDVPDRLPSFDETVVFHIVLARALAGLSPRERELIELVDIRRLTEREAADKLGISLGAAKSYRHGARMRLREDPDLVQLRTVA